MIITPENEIIDNVSAEQQYVKVAEEKRKPGAYPIVYYTINDLFDIESVFERIKNLLEILEDYRINYSMDDISAREKADALLVSLVDLVRIAYQEIQDIEDKYELIAKND